MRYPIRGPTYRVEHYAMVIKPHRTYKVVGATFDNTFHLIPSKVSHVQVHEMPRNMCLYFQQYPLTAREFLDNLFELLYRVEKTGERNDARTQGG